MRTSLLLLGALALANGDRPIFCNPVCSGGACTCEVIIHNRFEQRIYMPIEAGQSVDLILHNTLSTNLPVQLATPTLYKTLHSQFLTSFAVHSDGTFWKAERTVYYPYFQTVEHYLEANDSQVVPGENKFTVTNAYATGHMNVLIKVGAEYRVDVLEILTMPISMFQIHGYYWTQHGYFWIFTIVGVASATVYVLLGRLRLWQVVALYAASAFSIVFFEKLYHAILAAQHAGSTHEIAYAVVCIALLAEGIPFLFALLFLRQAVCQPIVWSILAIVIAIGFAFLAGAGWYMGTGLLLLAALTTACPAGDSVRYLVRFSCQVVKVANYPLTDLWSNLTLKLYD